MSKNVNNRKAAPKLIFFNEKIFRKIRTIFDVENWLWKSEFCNFQQLLRKITQYIKKLLGSSLAFSLKEDPVRCAKVCDKSWVILSVIPIPKRITCTYQLFNTNFSYVFGKKLALSILYLSSLFCHSSPHFHSPLVAITTLQMFCLLKSQTNVCKPSPQTTCSSFNKLNL